MTPTGDEHLQCSLPDCGRRGIVVIASACDARGRGFKPMHTHNINAKMALMEKLNIMSRGKGSGNHSVKLTSTEKLKSLLILLSAKLYCMLVSFFF